MNQEKKDSLFQAATAHVHHIQSRITESLTELRKAIQAGEMQIRSMSRADQFAQVRILAYQNKKVAELIELEPSPYFARCDIVFSGKKTSEPMYIAKFPFPEESIYSWVAPIAALRFESPGNFSYTKPDKTKEEVTLERKDQYMIVDRRLVFFATESKDAPRELVYQEHFSRKKDGFVLPEIVERMEKAQDQVIRADYRGPFVISGPAGSGKTTLALHRVAYLAQAPDTTELFRGNRMIVFVQDTGTKKYFAHLLPELGIHDVAITTFAEWAIRILDVAVSSVVRFGHIETEKDTYEWQKLAALRAGDTPPYSTQTFSFLEKVYAPFFSDTEKKLFQRQKKENVLDRFDLTILLLSYLKTKKQLEMPQDYFVQQKNNAVIRKVGRFPIDYTLMVVDEFQNYLPEQLLLLKQCVSERFQSMVYVGDMAQQIQVGTIREWRDIGEMIPVERKVMLQKVYRNTRQILEYIRSLGYTVTIPEQLKNGPDVTELIFQTMKEEVSYIHDVLANANYDSVGILAKDTDYLQSFRDIVGKKENIHVLTMSEAQGVEFDIVFLVGITHDLFFASPDLPELFQKEKQRIQKDLLYVALTRAIRELHVIGSERLSEILNKPQQ